MLVIHLYIQDGLNVRSLFAGVIIYVYVCLRVDGRVCSAQLHTYLGICAHTRIYLVSRTTVDIILNSKFCACNGSISPSGVTCIDGVPFFGESVA